MATRTQVLTLEAGAGEATGICRAALLWLGWEPVAEGEGLVAVEPADALCCAVWPVRVEVHVRPDSHGHSSVELDFSLPGRGVIQNRQLRDRMKAVGLSIVRAIDAAETGGRASRPSVARRDRAGSPTR